MRGKGGFTILEVIVATGLLSLGIVGLATLQTQALRSQQRVRVVRELVTVAEMELERRTSAAAAGIDDCHIPESLLQVVSECHSTREDCAGAAMVCGGPNAARAARITVRLRAQGGQEFELQALTADFSPP